MTHLHISDDSRCNGICLCVNFVLNATTDCGILPFPWWRTYSLRPCLTWPFHSASHSVSASPSAPLKRDKTGTIR